jgi:3-phenylpropionate/trans-cinnamate dioxygenase ferredoxin reductase component
MNTMEHYRYLIVGGGMAADAAVDGIREIDGDGSVGVVALETDPPYSRPPLSKGLWKGDDPESVWRHTEDKGAQVYLGRTIESIDAEAKQARDDQGGVYGFDALLLATGGTPRRLPFGGDDIVYYRTLRDYHRLRELTVEGERFAVIGGGFIGSEVAAALAMNGKHVTMVFPEGGIGAAVYPEDLSQFVNGYYREHGVELLPGEHAVGLERRGGGLTLVTKSGRELSVDGVVAGIGIVPNVQLAEAAGLAVGNGILVDELLRTSKSGVYATGDVAAFTSPQLGTRIRVEHEDNALTMGRHAGANMARALEGAEEVAYEHLPFFYSDLFDLGYEAVGELDARLEIVADWQQPFQQGVLYYLREGRVRGVLLWDVWGKVDAARELIAAPGPFAAGDLRGRIAA